MIRLQKMEDVYKSLIKVCLDGKIPYEPFRIHLLV